MTTKAILFDADGVVIHAEMFSLQYQRKFQVENEKMLPFFKGEFQDCLIGKKDLKKTVTPYLKEWKWDLSADNFLKLWFKSEHNIDQRIIDTIKKLRKSKIKCYLATNQEKYRTNYMIHEMEFKNIFDGVFSSAFVGFKKPEKEFYEYILTEINKEISIKPEEIMFFDDSKKHIIEAKNLNIDSHLFTSFKDFKKKIAHLSK